MEIYLDSCATTRTCEAAVLAAVKSMTKEYGNPSSLHKKGFFAENLVNDAKATIAKVIACDSGEIYFTSGATEANNLAILGAAGACKKRGTRIVISSIEHPSVKESAYFLKGQGYDIIEVKPNSEGLYTPEAFAKEVDEKTILVSAMLVNNETGLILPINEIAKAVKQKNKNLLMHVDAVQGFLKLPIKLKTSQVDMMSMSGHKVFAPKGIGVLYKKRGVRILSQSYGGGQQAGIRNGTESVPLITALESAVIDGVSNMEKNRLYYEMLKQHLITQLSRLSEIKINSTQNCIDCILNISVSGVRSEVMLHYLEQFDIYISSGSACSKGKRSYVLADMGLNSSEIDTAIRISFSPETTIEMLDFFVKKLVEGMNSLAKIK